jgi:hypothetical protein
MTRLPFEERDREWLKALQEACEMPVEQAPHIGPPLLSRLVATLLRQDAEIAKLRALLSDLTQARPLRLHGEGWIEAIDHVLAGESYTSVITRDR